MTKQVAVKPVDRLKAVMKSPTVQEQFKNALGKNSDIFVASVIELFTSDTNLQACEPGAVVMEALKAATLKLPINKSLGFAYVIPYKGKAQFQIGYKGLVQLAIRTNQYRHINAGCVREGELVSNDRMTGEIVLGESSGEKVVGYFAMLETLTGFRKVIYWSKEKVQAHKKQYSKANSQYAPWATAFDAMAKKTVLKALLGKYGIMSIEMVGVFGYDENPQESAQAEVDLNANSEPIDVTPGAVVDAEMTPEEIAEVENAEKAESGGPGF